MSTSLTARLVVRRADEALNFYQRAFGATTVERFTDDDGRVVHAAFSIDGVILALTEEHRAWNNDSPTTLGGSPVVLNLVVHDVDTVARKLEEAGAEVIFAVSDQYYGHREGRFRDPFGHLWIVTSIIEKLSPATIAARGRSQR